MSRTSNWADLIGRFFLALIFILAGINKAFNWNPTEAYMLTHGVPQTHWMLFAAIVIEIVCGLGILFGRYTRANATVLFLYLIPVTYFMHAFWLAPPPLVQNQLSHFLKNLGLIGALLFVAAHGPGRYSIDSLVLRAEERKRRRPEERVIRAA
jgi:putative oxidoreductase